MAKTVPTVFCVVSLFLMVACKSDEEKARNVAYNYIYAMANYNVSDAEKYATDETIETTLSLANSFLPSVDPEYIKSDTPATITITDFSFTSDTTVVVSYIKNTPIKHNIGGQLELVKRHDKWRAHDPLSSKKQQNASAR